MRTKVCSGECQRRLPLDEIHFAFKDKLKGLYRNDCKDCYNTKKSAKYAMDPIEKAKMLARQLETRGRNRRVIAGYLRDHPCVDCGETDGVVLEFDHVRGVKVKEVCWMALHHRKVSAILEEIAKCDVVCANCHRRRTAKRVGWDRHYNGSVIEQGTITDF